VRPELVVRVPSLTRAGTRYDITRRGNDLACECLAFAFNRRRGRGCKHLRVYMAAERALARCHERHGGDGAHVCRQCLVELLAFTVAKAMKVQRKGKEAHDRIGLSG